MNRPTGFWKRLPALLREGFIRIATTCIDKLQKDAAQVMFMKGGFCWYDHGTYYNCYTYKMNAAGTTPTDTKVYPSIQVKHSNFTDLNNFDDGLMLVAGDTLGQFTCRRISADANQVVFRIDVKISDTFDFYGSSYSGSKEPSVRHAYRGFFFERKIYIFSLDTFQSNASHIAAILQFHILL